MDDGEMSRASKGRMTELFANNRRVFDALGRKVTPYAWDKEVVPGVTAVGTPGHSIGHTSFVVASGGKSVFVQSDVCNNIDGVRAASGLARLLRPGSAEGRGDAAPGLRHAGRGKTAGAGLSLSVPGARARREGRAGLSGRADQRALTHVVDLCRIDGLIGVSRGLRRMAVNRTVGFTLEIGQRSFKPSGVVRRVAVSRGVERHAPTDGNTRERRRH